MSVRNAKNVAISTFISITVTSHSSRYGGKKCQLKIQINFFKDDGNRSRYIYVYFDEPELGILEDWLDKYKGTVINSLEVKPYVYKDKDKNDKYIEYMASKVIVDVSIPNKYFYKGVSGPDNYL